MGRLEDARDHKMTITGIERLHGHPKYHQFVQDCDAKEKQFFKIYEEEEFKQFMRDTCNGGAKQVLGFCDSYLLSRYILFISRRL